MRNKIVICDLDGTIVDSRADLTATVNHVRAHYNLPPLDIDTVTGYVGNGARVLIEKSLCGTSADIDEAYTIMQTAYHENILCKTTVYPTVIEGLETLKSNGYKLAIATNKPQAPTDSLLDALKLKDYFDIILGGSEEYALKPDPAMLHIAMQKTDSAPEMSWMIGDNYTDMESGYRAGIKTCFAEYGFGEKRDTTNTISVTSFAEFANKKIKKIQ